MNKLTIAVSGLHRGDNPQPGPAVISAIRQQFPEVKIVGLSYDPLESGLYTNDVDNAFLMPFPMKGPKVLLERVDEIRQKYAVDMIIPCLDSEIENYIELADEFKERGIHIPQITKKAFDRRSKENLNKLGKQANVFVPRTIACNTLADAMRACEKIGFPVFVKGKMYGGRYSDNLAGVSATFSHLVGAWGPPVLIQEAMPPADEYDVVGLGDGKGGIIGFCSIRKMMLTDAGKAFAGIVVDDPELNRIVRRVIAALKWWGPFELEFVKDKQYALIEMNPRFPAWVGFPSQIGCNLPATMVQMMLYGGAEKIKSPEPGKMFIRHAVDIVSDISQLATITAQGNF